MQFWEAAGETLWSLRTPFLIAGFLLTALLQRASSAGQKNSTSAPSVAGKLRSLRGATFLLLGHLGAAVTAIAILANGGSAFTATLVALAFELLCIVALTTAAVFGTILPRLGIALPRILADIVTAVLVLVAMIIVGKRAGFSVAGLITTSAVLTAVIGFALQDTLGNIMGGLALQMDNSVKVGDWITLGPNQPQGRVSEIRWRYTAIETRAWETIIIPNGMLMRSQVTILGRRESEPLQWRRDLDFFVDFRTPPQEVFGVVAEIAQSSIADVALQPRLHAVLFGYRDSVAHYRLRYWLTDLARDELVDSELRSRLWYSLKRADIALAIPASAMFLTSESEKRDESKLTREKQRRLAALAKVDLFASLDQRDREQLVEHMTYVPYAAGEVVTSQGEHANDLFMVLEGTAAVSVAIGGTSREVARLAAGEFFGEMSLMTGESRTATVVAATQLVCYRISKEGFSQLLQRVPQLAEPIAEVLATRKSKLDSVKGDGHSDQSAQISRAKIDLMARIRGFFGIESK